MTDAADPAGADPHRPPAGGADPVSDVDGEADDPGSSPAPGGRSAARTARISTAVGVVLGGAAVVLVVRTLVADWDEASAAVRGAEAGWLLAAVVLAAAAMTSIGLVWGLVLRQFAVHVPPARVVAWYFTGELGKYLPGGVWPVLGRGELARRGGVPRTRAYASVALSLGMLYLAAMFVAAALLPFAVSSEGASPWMAALLALPVGVVALHHEVLERLVALIGRVTGRQVGLAIPRWRQSLTLVAAYVPTWLFVGVATWAVARAITPDASPTQVVFAAVLSWVVGFLAVPVPAGAGVREAVLLAASGLDGGVAAATAIIARVIFVGVDAVGGLAGAPLSGRRRQGVRVGPLSDPADRAAPESR